MSEPEPPQPDAAAVRSFATARRILALGSPLLLVALAVPLWAPAQTNPPFLVLGLAAAAAVVMAFFGYHLPTPRAPGKTPGSARQLAPIVALFLGYSAGASALAIQNHLSFNTDRADLGYYVTVFRRSSLGDFLGCTICNGGNHALDGHFDPLLVLLSPLYLIYPEAETLLVLQSAWLAGSVFPLFLLARHYRLPPVVQYLVPLCFCLHPALHGINLFDFHSLALAVPLIVWLLWSLETHRYWFYWVFLSLFLLVREDTALLALFFAVHIALTRKPGSWRRAAITAAAALGYFFLAKSFMGSADPLSQEASRGYAYYYEDLVPNGGGARELLSNVVLHPLKVAELVFTEQKWKFVLQLLLPVAFLPLLARSGKLFLVYGFAFTLLASRIFVYSIHFHYTAIIVPFLFALALAALGRWHNAGEQAAPRRDQWARAGAFAMLGATLFCSWQFGALVDNHSFRAGFRELRRTPSKSQLKLAHYLKELCRDLPPGSSVAANERQLPHLGRCHAIYRRHQRRMADYVVWVHQGGRSGRQIDKDVRRGYLELVKQTGKWKLYKTNYPDRTLVPE